MAVAQIMFFLTNRGSNWPNMKTKGARCRSSRDIPLFLMGSHGPNVRNNAVKRLVSRCRLVYCALFDDWSLVSEGKVFCWERFFFPLAWFCWTLEGLPFVMIETVRCRFLDSSFKKTAKILSGFVSRLKLLSVPFEFTFSRNLVFYNRPGQRWKRCRGGKEDWDCNGDED